MNSFVRKLIFCVVGIAVSPLSSAVCLPVLGTVQTQSISSTVQVGQVTMTSNSPLQFRRAFGNILITGGIRGEITGADGSGNPILKHEFGFPGTGSFISLNDVATFPNGPFPDAQGNISVVETAPITAPDLNFGGAFVGWSGLLTARGTLNVYTNTNSFTYSGQLCKP